MVMYEQIVSGIVTISDELATSLSQEISAFLMDRELQFLQPENEHEEFLEILEEIYTAITYDKALRKAVFGSLKKFMSCEQQILAESFLPRDYRDREAYDLLKQFITLGSLGDEEGKRNLLEEGTLSYKTMKSDLNLPLSNNLAEKIAITNIFSTVLLSGKRELLNAYLKTYKYLRNTTLDALRGRLTEESSYTISTPRTSSERQLRELFMLFLKGCLQDISSIASPKARVVAIFEEKSAYSILHHRNAYVNGQNLGDLFAKESLDMPEFVDCLKESRWIDAKNPEASSFFTKLTNFGGRMFGVFTDEELNDVKKWVSSNEDNVSNQHIRIKRLQELDKSLDVCVKKMPLRGEVTKHRDLFRQLILHPHKQQSLNNSRYYLQTVLKHLSHSEMISELGEEYIFGQYTESGFISKIDDIYQLQQENYSGFPDEKILDVNQLLKMHLFLSPITLVDGCWLEGIYKFFGTSSKSNRNLFEIYYDEIGNGDYQYNHVKMFIDLLNNLGAEGIDPCSAAFCRDERMSDSAFQISCLLLSLSKNPREYYPEILGLTMSVELSGLGGMNQFLISQLEKNNIKSDFWRVHVSVDNLSTGHSHKARAAISEHMRIGQLMGNNKSEQQNLWNRIWTGFLCYRYLEKKMQASIWE